MLHFHMGLARDLPCLHGIFVVSRNIYLICVAGAVAHMCQPEENLGELLLSYCVGS